MNKKPLEADIEYCNEKFNVVSFVEELLAMSANINKKNNVPKENDTRK